MLASNRPAMKLQTCDRSAHAGKRRLHRPPSPANLLLAGDINGQSISFDVHLSVIKKS